MPPVAPARLFLKKGGLSSCRCRFTSPRSLLPDGCSSLSWRWTHTVSVGAVSASQFHKGPSGGQSQAGACRDRSGAGSWRGLEGFVAGEHVPGGDQDLARDRGFRGVVVAGAAADVEVELVPRVRFAPGVLGGLDRGPAEQPRARLVQRTGVRPTFTGLADTWREPTVGDELLRTGEAADLADLDRDRQGEQLGEGRGSCPAAPRAGRPGRTVAARRPAARSVRRGSRSVPDTR